MKVKGWMFSSICETKILIVIQNAEYNNIWQGNDHIDIAVDDLQILGKTSQLWM